MLAAAHLLLADERVTANDDVAVRVEVIKRLVALLLGPQRVALLEKVLPLVAVGVGANGFARAALEAVAKLERVRLLLALHRKGGMTCVRQRR